MAASRTVRLVFLVSLGLSCAGHAAAQQPQQDEYESLLEDAQRKLLKGEMTSAGAALQEILDAFAEEPEGSRPQASTVEAARLLLIDIDQRSGNYEKARAAIEQLAPEVLARRNASLLHARILARTGGYEQGCAILERLLAADAKDVQVRYELADLNWRDGHRQKARELWQANVDGPRPDDALQLAFLGRSLWRLGGRQNFESGSQALVDSLAKAPDRPEARITLGQLKLEAYGEAAGFPSGEKDLTKVLDKDPANEEALLVMYRIRSANQVLDGGKTEHFLDRVLERNPRCVEALTLRASNVLDDRRYRAAAERLDAVLAIDPNDRIALSHRAAAAFLLHEEGDYNSFRARAAAGDPRWPVPDRILGDHLVALYRFADALPFYSVALQAAPDDIDSLQGMAKALIYTGEGKRAKELLEHAKAIEAGMVDPWRNNALAAQDLLDTEYTLVENDKFRVEMHRDDVEVLQTYLMPVLLEAAEVLGAKYNYHPANQVKVESFHTWDDFSVRTIGFRGFTALGACFGSLITLVSPVDADLRKQDFMWEATAWHEYTHVLTLGLSRSRVPRWLTEGFSVYEEKARDRAWERGMDRELFDAFHNRDIPPVQLMNRLFRGPRILFGYYQGGLIVELIAKQYGFDKAIDLLKAFGEDKDTEDAFQTALGISSAKFDTELLQFIEQEKLRGMRLVQHFDDTAMQMLVLRAGRDKTNLQVRSDLAWACLQRDNPVDAGRWLAEVFRADPEHGQALLARAELFMRRKEVDEAIACWKRGFATGADDFDSRIRCGDAMLAAGDAQGAEDMWQRAKACWPGCTEQQNAPELRLAKLYRDQGDKIKAQMEMKAYCRRTARAFTPRLTLAAFEKESGNRSEELKYLIECNRIDPFERDLHVRLGEAYEALGKPAQAAMEYEVAAAVSPLLDRRAKRPDFPHHAPDSPEEKAERGDLWVRAARLRHGAGDAKRASELLARVLREAPDTSAATDATGLQQDWQGH